MPSRRAAVAGLIAALVLGACLLLAGALATRSTLVGTIGVLPVYPVAPLAPGQEVCQSPIGLADPLERVRFNMGQFGRRGPALDVTVKAAGTPRVLGRGHEAGGWPDDGSAHNIPVGRVAADQSVSVCIRNAGARTGYVYGDIYVGSFGTGPLGVRPTHSHSSAAIDGVPIPGDVSLKFVSDQPRSLLARLPDAFRHASAFRPAFMGTWTFWLLAVLIVAGAPLALARALSLATRDPGPDPPLPSSPSR